MMVWGGAEGRKKKNFRETGGKGGIRFPNNHLTLAPTLLAGRSGGSSRLLQEKRRSETGREGARSTDGVGMPSTFSQENPTGQEVKPQTVLIAGWVGDKRGRKKGQDGQDEEIDFQDASRTGLAWGKRERVFINSKKKRGGRVGRGSGSIPVFLKRKG